MVADQILMAAFDERQTQWREQGDRQAMLFNTIDPYVTPGRRLFFF